MGIAHDAVTAVGRALGNVHAGTAKLASRKVSSDPASLTVTSAAFASGAPLPRTATTDDGGEGAPPPLAWSNVPPGARALVIVCEDPDAPFPEPFVHWTVYGIPPTARATPPHEDGSTWREGKNSKLKTGFTGAAPPPGHGLHHYHFQVFALDTELTLEGGAGRGALLDAMRGHVLAWGEHVGTHARA